MFDSLFKIISYDTNNDLPTKTSIWIHIVENRKFQVKGFIYQFQIPCVPTSSSSDSSEEDENGTHSVAKDKYQFTQWYPDDYEKREENKLNFRDKVGHYPRNLTNINLILSPSCTF